MSPVQFKKRSCRPVELRVEGHRVDRYKYLPPYGVGDYIFYL